MVLNKRIYRDILDNKFHHLALLFLIIISMTLVISFAASTDSIDYTINKYQDINNVEDGEFRLFDPLTEESINELENMGVTIEESFYYDITSMDDKIIRVFKVRDNINTINITNGEIPSNDNELFLEKNYSLINEYSISENIIINGKDYTITGTGTVPDYNYSIANITDLASDYENFGIGFVTKDEFDNLSLSNEVKDSIKYNYSYVLEEGIIDSDLKDYLLNSGESNISNYTNLVMFTESDENVRINGAADDAVYNKTVAIIAGVILTVLIAYMISVFAVSNIDKESVVIGSLYSLGYSKKELMRHYLKVPIITVIIGSVIGTVVGFSLIIVGAYNNILYYSYPNIEYVYPLYLIFFGIGMPIFVVIIVNCYVLNNRLSDSPVKLLRKERKKTVINSIKLSRLNFINKYRIRQILREIRSNITMFFGLFVSILIFMFGMCIYGSVSNLINHITDGVNYEYMYILRQPLEEVPDDVEIGYSKEFSILYELDGSTMDITIQGIDTDNKFFDFSNDLEYSELGVYISSSAAEKFGYKTGDTFIVNDLLTDKEFEYSILGEVEYGNGLYFYTNIESMRSSFNMDDGYYNTIFSNDEVIIESDNIVVEVTTNDIQNSVSSLMGTMLPIIIMLIISSILIFIIVMYLLIKIMIERSMFSISLIKVFGYNEAEVNKLYLGSSFFIVLLSVIIAVPLNKLIVNKIYPYVVANVRSGMECYLSPSMYVFIISIIIVTYLFTNSLLVRHLKKISFVEILKNRE